MIISFTVCIIDQNITIKVEGISLPCMMMRDASRNHQNWSVCIRNHKNKGKEKPRAKNMGVLCVHNSLFQQSKATRHGYIYIYIYEDTTFFIKTSKSKYSYSS